MKSPFLKPCLVLLSLITVSISAQERTLPFDQDEELGKVSWYRDYDEAVALSKQQNKPILILFQEVPGCATCRNYGHNVLSNPLMTEVIENEFIPLAIFNNKGGKDKQILQKFKEPSWNNPVVRIVDVQGKDLTRRIAQNYSASALYLGMKNVLLKTEGSIPAYMSLLGEELSVAKSTTKEAHFKMYCFWTGEKELGAPAGVLNTEAGFIGHSEVVKVTYNSEEISKEQLTQYAERRDMAPIANNGKYRIASKDEDYYLRHSNYKYLPLSKLQRTKINSALGYGQSPRQYLSPSQYRWLDQIDRSEIKKEIRYNKSFAESWELQAKSSPNSGR